MTFKKIKKILGIVSPSKEWYKGFCNIPPYV